MKKSFTILFLMTIIIISFSIYYVKIHEKGQLSETTLVKSFNNSGARVVSGEIYFWGKLDSSYSDIKKLKQLTDVFSSKLGIVKDNYYSNKSFNNDLIQKVELKGKLAENRYINISVQSESQKDGKDEKYITINVIQDLSGEGLDDIRQGVLKVFKNQNINPKVNTCLTGYFDGKLDNRRLNDISKQIFKEAEANKVEGIKDSNLISVAAYSPMIEDFINVNGKKVNLNLAIRYNSFENKTYIWLATPVISIEY